MQPIQPFMPADDLDEQYVTEDPIPLPPITLSRLHLDMVTGFAGIHKRMDGLATRVVQLEADAAWKRWAVRAGKAALPFAAGLLAHYFPDLARHLPALINAIGSAQ